MPYKVRIIQFTTLCLMKKLDNVASISLYSCKLHCVELSHGKYTLKTYLKPTFVLNLTQHIRSLSIVINSVLADNDFCIKMSTRHMDDLQVKCRLSYQKLHMYYIQGNID